MHLIVSSTLKCQGCLGRTPIWGGNFSRDKTRKHANAHTSFQPLRGSLRTREAARGGGFQIWF